MTHDKIIRQVHELLLKGNESEPLPPALEESEKVLFSAGVWGWCVLLAFLLLAGCWATTAHAYTLDQWADSIYKAENSQSHPYGIMVKYRSTSPRQACMNTVAHKYRDWANLQSKDGLNQSFLAYLASKYAPIGHNDTGTNQFWAKNVWYFLTTNA